MQSHEHVVVRFTRNNCDVVGSGGAVAICTEIESSVFGGNTSLHLKDHPLVSNRAVSRNTKVNPVGVVIDFLDELSNRDNGNPLSLAHFKKLGESQELTVVPDNFTNDCHWLEPRQLHELNSSLGVTRALSYPSGCRLQGEDVAGSNQGGGG